MLLCRELHTPLRDVLDMDIASALRLLDSLDVVERRRRADDVLDVSAAASSVMDGGKVRDSHIKWLTKGQSQQREGTDVNAFMAAFGMGM